MNARDPIALSTTQSGLSKFYTASGYVPYVTQGGSTLTLGAPICDEGSTAELTQQFLNRHPDATFFYVTEAQRRRMGLSTHVAWPAGADFLLRLPHPSWPKEAAAADRKARRAGFTVRELSREALVSLEPAMREAQRAYLSGREVETEMRFLTRPCLFSKETAGRTFALEVRGAFLGFVVLDPYRTEEGFVGHLLNLFRIGPTKLWGVYHATVIALAELLTTEGCSELSLGFVPLAPTSEALPWWLGAQVNLLRKLARRSPYLRGLWRMKSLFQARQVTRYFVSRRSFIARDVHALLGAMGTAS